MGHAVDSLPACHACSEPAVLQLSWRNISSRQHELDLVIVVLLTGPDAAGSSFACHVGGSQHYGLSGATGEY